MTRSKLNILKGDVVIDCMKTVKENGELHELWQHMTGELKFALTDDNSTKVLLFDKCCKLLFGELIERYLKMAVGEFLRDFRRDVEWKKAEAHRRKLGFCAMFNMHMQPIVWATDAITDKYLSNRLSYCMRHSFMILDTHLHPKYLKSI